MTRQPYLEEIRYHFFASFPDLTFFLQILDSMFVSFVNARQSVDYHNKARDSRRCTLKCLCTWCHDEKSAFRPEWSEYYEWKQLAERIGVRFPADAKKMPRVAAKWLAKTGALKINDLI